MALQCNVVLNVGSYTAGQNPPPQAALVVYNPNASAVVVTSIQMSATQVGSTSALSATALEPSVPPIGPGMLTTVPALSSITIGPFPIVVGSAAAVNPFQAVNQSGNLQPINPQGSQLSPFQLYIGAQVGGSDGSTNVAGVAGLLVSPSVPPPLGFQGGFLQFASPNNLATGLLLGGI